MKQTDFVQMMADLLEVEPSEIRSESELLDFPLFNSVCALRTIGDVEALVSCHVGIEA